MSVDFYSVDDTSNVHDWHGIQSCVEISLWNCISIMIIIIIGRIHEHFVKPHVASDRFIFWWTGLKCV